MRSALLNYFLAYNSILGFIVEHMFYLKVLQALNTESLVNIYLLGEGGKPPSFSCTKEAGILITITRLHTATTDLLLEAFSKGAGKYHYLLR